METNDIKIAQKAILKVFKAYVSFCEKNGLSYYAVGGTCLGAIRHKGYIPWDDDIDVAMPRDDYEKLISLRKKLQGTGYEIYNFGDSSEESGTYITPFAKFCNANSTIWEKKGDPFIFGIYIDIFPYDDVNDIDKSRKLFLKYRKTTEYLHYSWHNWDKKDLIRALKGNHPRDLTRFFLYSLMPNFLRHKVQTHFFDLAKKLEKKVINHEGNYCICYCGSYSFDKEIMSKNIFGRGVKVPFEDTEIVVPENYLEYLKHFFGDWQTPPPPEQRISHHYRYYINYNERHSLDYIRKLNLPEEDDIDYEYI